MVRSDARENRDRILAVARRTLEESGDASLNRIAQLAGVGPGTLYRHFPTREALVLAVYEDEIDRLTASVRPLLDRLPPVEALTRWTTDLVAAMRRKHGLGEALSAAAEQAVTARSYGPVLAALTVLLDAGKADGSIREDADPADLLMLTGSLWRAAGHPDADPERMLGLVVDGLRGPGRPPVSR